MCTYLFRSKRCVKREERQYSNWTTKHAKKSQAKALWIKLIAITYWLNVCWLLWPILKSLFSQIVHTLFFCLPFDWRRSRGRCRCRCRCRRHRCYVFTLPMCACSKFIMMMIIIIVCSLWSVVFFVRFLLLLFRFIFKRALPCRFGWTQFDWWESAQRV